jgi:toxin ParE1/3/4
MGVYRPSRLAESDLANIFEYGIEKFGLQLARNYLVELQNAFQALADNPNLGRSAFEFSTGLRRFSYEAHIIFYLPTGAGIFIVRVLNQSMDFDLHL